MSQVQFLMLIHFPFYTCEVQLHNISIKTLILRSCLKSSFSYKHRYVVYPLYSYYLCFKVIDSQLASTLLNSRFPLCFQVPLAIGKHLVQAQPFVYALQCQIKLIKEIMMILWGITGKINVPLCNALNKNSRGINNFKVIQLFQGDIWMG